MALKIIFKIQKPRTLRIPTLYQSLLLFVPYLCRFLLKLLLRDPFGRVSLLGQSLLEKYLKLQKIAAKKKSFTGE